jgi:hypothetical protein
MANLIRLAKSASDWTSNDLEAYNIHIVYQDVQQFFGLAADDDVPFPEVDDDFLNAVNVGAALAYEHQVDTDTICLLAEMGKAMRAGAIEASVNLFSSRLHGVHATRFVDNEQGRSIDAQTRLRFWVSGVLKHAKPDFTIEDENGFILLVQEDKRYMSNARPEAQLVAQAIAAFKYNNDRRMERLLDPLDHAIILGITMKGTAPAFYRIPVTAALVTAVHFGLYPGEPTEVHAHLPEIPEPGQRYVEGIIPLDNRQITLSCYSGFRGDLVPQL